MNINNRLITVSSNVFILQQFHTFENIAASLGIEFCKDAVFLCLSEKDLQLARGQDLSANKLNDIQSLGHQFEIDNFSHSHKFIQNLLAQSPDFAKYVVYSCSSDLLPEMAWVFALTRNAKKILLGTNKKFVVFLYRGRANDLLLFDEKEQIKNQNEISLDLEKKVEKAPFFNFFSSFQGFLSP
ncbi:hypothetical protein OAH90_02715, partial [Alphaproteobacteria bacterium]|nr:hypothetical protein [Alphaproteobacteria bacterium]